MDRQKFIQHTREHCATSQEAESTSDTESHDTLSSNQQSDPEFRCQQCGYMTNSGKVCDVIANVWMPYIQKSKLAKSLASWPVTGKLATFILATWNFCHYSIYESQKI